MTWFARQLNRVSTRHELNTRIITGDREILRCNEMMKLNLSIEND